MTKTVMILKESTATETISELKDVIAKEPVLIKIMPDLEFDLNFKKTVDISIDIDDETLLGLTRIAHGRDITLNHLINEVLLNKMKEDKEKVNNEPSMSNQIDKQLNDPINKHLTAKAETSFEVKKEKKNEYFSIPIPPIPEDTTQQINFLVDNMITSL